MALRKLTQAQENELIRRRANGELIKVLAWDYGISEGTVTTITRHLVAPRQKAIWPLLVARIKADGPSAIVRDDEPEWALTGGVGRPKVV